MTRPLRRTHFLAWIVLSLVLPALLILALSNRPAEPSNPQWKWEKVK